MNLHQSAISHIKEKPKIVAIPIAAIAIHDVVVFV
jgi:hypothetical protein